MTEEVVKVLYDYSYTDERGNVIIKAGDVYRLIEKTNDEWWQVYDPSDEDGESFFVPAQYIEIVSNTSPWQALSDFDKVLLTEGTKGSPTPDYSSDDADNPQSVSAQGTTFNGEEEGDYVNLDLYRDSAGITKPLIRERSKENIGVNSASDNSKAAVPIELIQGTIPPPLPEEGSFIEVLMKGLPWDVYREHIAGRRYYVNRVTGERMWKPPRKEKVPTPTSSTSTDPMRSPKQEECVIPEEYEQVHDNGNLYFIHKSGKEKDYFFQRDVAWEPQGPRLSTFGGQSMRASKTMSTFGLPDSPSAATNKSSTLPANFTAPYANLNERNPPSTTSSSAHPSNPTVTITPAAKPAPPLPKSLPPSSVSTGSSPSEPIFINNEVYGSYLNRKTIADTGKKKVKKHWSQVYVLLQGSNLIFYKDEKSAKNAPGTPHGIPEGVVSLQGAHVDFNPSKEISGTSKKNVILLASNSGITFLFQWDNEKIIREWLTRLKIVANDVAETSPRPFEGRDDKKGPSRSISVDDSSSNDKKSFVSIKAKLFNFFNIRPTQEDLIKRGIIKDSVFGCRLNELCDKEKSHVPSFVLTCIQAVEYKGLTHDGMYRVSGNMAEIQRLRYAVEKDEKCNLFDEQWDVHVLTGSLKLFFRELKEPIFPFHLYNKLVDAIQKVSKKDKLYTIKSAISNLPRCNYYTLKELFQHLRKVVELSHENRMEPQNVAIVFGPTLLWQEKDVGNLALHTVFQSKIVEVILLEYSDLFK